MRKFLKLACLILCVVIVGATLCGCQQLDELRERTAVFTDEKLDAFTFRGYNYKFITAPTDVNFILINTDGDYKITEKDVPVLLADSFGYPLIFERTDDAPVVTAAINVSVDKTDSFEDMVGSFRNSYYSEDRFTYYIREDKYDATKKLLENAVLDRYYMNVWESTDEYTEWGSQIGYDRSKLIDQDMTDAVNRTLKSGEKATWIDLEQKRTEWYSFQIYPCDEDILITNGKIYNVVTDTFDYYIYEDNNDSVLYKASDEDFEAFRKMYKLNNESIGMEDIEWHIRNSESGWN